MAMQRDSTMGDFTFLKKLGEGAFGQVHLVKRKTDGHNYAFKKVRLIGLKDKDKNNALNEIRILASINEEYVIKFKDAFFDEVSNSLCIVMQYANGGDVSKLINRHKQMNRKIPEAEIWKALVHICKGLESLHEKKILHRDLKSANVFIHDGVYKLGDLNVSKVLKKELAETQTGTPYYASPQVWQDLPYDRKSDMWSLGCVLYEMATLEPPFKANDLQSLYKKVIAGKFKPISSYYSKQLNDTISALLKVKAKQRPDAHFFLKNELIKEKLGSTTDCLNEEKQNHIHYDLLETIKYNPRNPKSLNLILPKSSYDKEEKGLSLKNKVRTQSVGQNTSFATDRTLSQRKMRARSRQSTEGRRKQRQLNNYSQVRKESEKYLPSIPHRKSFLPQIPNLNPKQQIYRNNQGRLSRVARNILNM